ncbi:RNA-binding protein [Schizosaccharomyces pombe]
MAIMHKISCAGSEVETDRVLEKDQANNGHFVDSDCCFQETGSTGTANSICTLNDSEDDNSSLNSVDNNECTNLDCGGKKHKNLSPNPSFHVNINAAEFIPKSHNGYAPKSMNPPPEQLDSPCYPHFDQDSSSVIYPSPPSTYYPNMYVSANTFMPMPYAPYTDNMYHAKPVNRPNFLPREGTPPPFAQQPAEQFSPFNSEYESLLDFRALILSNLPVDYKISELLSLIHSGPLEKIQSNPGKRRIIITFLDSADAFFFYERYHPRGFIFHGRPLKLTFARPSPLPESIQNFCSNTAASRNVFIGNLPSSYHEKEIEEAFGKFGKIEHIKILSKKNIAFVHFLNIRDAIKVVRTLSCDPDYHSWRIFFGSDRCANHPPSFDERSCFTSKQNPDTTSNRCRQQESKDNGNRTVFLGNLHTKTKGHEICDLIRHGGLQDFHYIPEKHICFVTFITYSAANAFHDYLAEEEVLLHGRRIKVGWGKESGPLPRVLEDSILMGASRNVYFSHISDSLTTEELELILRQYGEIESIKYLKNRSSGFVAYTNISNAMKAVNGLPIHPLFKKSKIRYAPDRCEQELQKSKANSPIQQNVPLQRFITPPFSYPVAYCPAIPPGSDPRLNFGIQYQPFIPFTAVPSFPFNCNVPNYPQTSDHEND